MATVMVRSVFDTAQEQLGNPSLAVIAAPQSPHGLELQAMSYVHIMEFRSQHKLYGHVNRIILQTSAKYMDI